jgi:peptidoglycan/xylan/chitin deacetylase (PgdA/CDA1 family)
VALTFDAGSNADGFPAIVATLEETGTPATFFMTGKWAQLYPQYAHRLGTEFLVGNHTFDHPHLTQLSDVRIRTEIAAAEAAIRQAAGRDPKPYFRFPYGDQDPRVQAIVESLGYRSVGWTIDTLGWKGRRGGQTRDSVIRRVLGALQPSEIVLLHVGSSEDGSTLDADALPQILAAIRARGYRFATLNDLR